MDVCIAIDGSIGRSSTYSRRTRVFVYVYMSGLYCTSDLHLRETPSSRIRSCALLVAIEIIRGDDEGVAERQTTGWGGGKFLTVSRRAKRFVRALLQSRSRIFIYEIARRATG